MVDFIEVSMPKIGVTDFSHLVVFGCLDEWELLFPCFLIWFFLVSLGTQWQFFSHHHTGNMPTSLSRLQRWQLRENHLICGQGQRTQNPNRKGLLRSRPFGLTPSISEMGYIRKTALSGCVTFEMIYAGRRLSRTSCCGHTYIPIAWLATKNFLSRSTSA